MADTQNPVYVDNVTLNGDGTEEHPLSVANPVSPAQVAAIPQKFSVTLTAAQLKTLDDTVPVALPVIAAPADPTKRIVIISCLMIYNAGAVGYTNNAGELFLMSHGDPGFQTLLGCRTDGVGGSQVLALDLSMATSQASYGSPGFSAPLVDANYKGKGVDITYTSDVAGALATGDGTLTIEGWYNLL